MKYVRVFFLFSIVLLISSCATSVNKNTENCLFGLDTEKYAAAVTECTKAVNSDPDNEFATMLLSSAYAGLGGVDIIALEKELADESNEETAFKDIHTALVGTIGSSGLSDLRTSITTLTGFPGTPVDTENFYGQLGLLQAIEAFALPTLTAQPVSGGTIDVTLIDSTDKDNVQSDFIDCDSNLADRAGWSSERQLLKAIRKNYCVLKNVSTGQGFEIGALRDITLCQLTPDPSTLTPADFETVSACSDFNFSACSGTDPNTL